VAGGSVRAGLMNGSSVDRDVHASKASTRAGASAGPSSRWSRRRSSLGRSALGCCGPSHNWTVCLPSAHRAEARM
jgi:hypothetical protein